MGLVKFTDAESGEIKWMDTNSAHVRKNYFVQSKKRDGKLVSIFRRSGVDIANINTRESYIKPLMSLFKQRGK